MTRVDHSFTLSEGTGRRWPLQSILRTMTLVT
jgi:hypothetical protein